MIIRLGGIFRPSTFQLDPLLLDALTRQTVVSSRLAAKKEICQFAGLKFIHTLQEAVNNYFNFKIRRK